MDYNDHLNEVKLNSKRMMAGENPPTNRHLRMKTDESSKVEFNIRNHGNHVWDTYSYQMKNGFKD